MVPTLDDLIRLNQFSPGRRIFALRAVQSQAQALSFAELASHCTEAMAHDHQTRALDMDWAGRSEPVLRAIRPLEVDSLVDRALTALRDSAMAQTRSARPGDALVDKAHQLVRAVFPAGVAAVTRLAHVDELAAVDVIVGKLRGELAPLVAELGLGRQVDRLAELAEEYRAVLSHRPATLAFDTVRASRDRGQRYLLQAVAMIVGRYYQDTPEHEAARAALLGPILTQNEAIRAHLRGRRTVEDVDPETGEPEDTPETGEPSPELPDAPAG